MKAKGMGSELQISQLIEAEPSSLCRIVLISGIRAFCWGKPLLSLSFANLLSLIWLATKRLAQFLLDLQSSF